MKNKIALLPLDNRPVSYLLPKQIADFSGINLILPERKYLGDITTNADLPCIENWMKNLDNELPFVIALDTYMYGGLVQSRKHNFGLDELKKRARKLQELPSPKYGFTTIMRISNSNSTDEEKEYWKEYGEKIHKWSELMHKVGRGICDKETTREKLIDDWYKTTRLIPPEILANYRELRNKNMTINNLWLEMLHDNAFKYLLFSCDDSSKYGINVVEAEYLKKQISKHKFSYLTRVISGTDEISLLLITKVFLEASSLSPSIEIYFNDENSKNEYGRYESSTIWSLIQDQINMLNLVVKDEKEADIIVCVHLAPGMQGDHVFNNAPNDTSKNVEKLIAYLEKLSKPFILIDLAYANGSDPNLIKGLINAKINWQNCYGYAGWNTAANSSGSALSMGICRWISEKTGTFNCNLFNEALLIRFLDDYVYQTQVRSKEIVVDSINKEVRRYAHKFLPLFNGKEPKISCTLPWNRSFEVEINL